MRIRVLVLLAIWLANPCSAEAHALLERAAPRVGSTVESAPAELRLRFSEAVEGAFSQITLSTKDGGAIALGPLGLDPQDERTLVATVPGTLAPGVYKVSWRVVSVDTHSTEGDYTFEVKP